LLSEYCPIYYPDFCLGLLTAHLLGRSSPVLYKRQKEEVEAVKERRSEDLWYWWWCQRWCQDNSRLWKEEIGSYETVKNTQEDNATKYRSVRRVRTGRKRAMLFSLASLFIGCLIRPLC
jgi:hypothetical protein